MAETPPTLADAFGALLRADPDGVVCRSPGRVTTRAEIDADARRLEARLAGAPAPGTVALAIGNGAWLAAAFLAVRRARRPALMLDGTIPRPTLLAMAKALGAGALVTDGGLEPIEPRPGVRLPGGTEILKVSSGSTGAPRAIAFRERQVLADAALLFRAMGLVAGDRALALVPMSFSYGLSSLLIPALCEGLELVIPDAEGPLAPLAAAEAGRATCFPAVPVLLSGLCRLESARLPDSLRLVVSAGAPLAPAAARAFGERFGRRVHAFYGASECGGICYDAGGEAALRGTVGSPLPGVSVSIVGDDGTVAVESARVALGYVPADPAAHAGPLGAGRFVSSDCGRLEDGELSLLGRKSETINVDGRKVHPREIEDVLAGLPGVRDVAVVRDEGGPAREACWALIAAEPGSISRAQVLSWCRERLPVYMIPRRISVLEHIPRTDRGKLDREAVRRLAAGHEAERL
jgi:long-chain acyl-CoA synthetase